MTRFRVSLDASEATLADGRPLVRGEEINLTKEDQDDAFNTRLITEGQLIAPEKDSDAAQKETKDSNDKTGGDDQ